MQVLQQEKRRKKELEMAQCLTHSQMAQCLTHSQMALSQVTQALLMFKQQQKAAEAWDQSRQQRESKSAADGGGW